MTEGEWRLRAGLLKNRLASYGLSVVRFVSLPGLAGSALGELLAEIGREGGPKGGGPHGALPRSLHLTLLPVLRSRFALPEDRQQAEACRAELVDLALAAPVDDDLRPGLARLEEATAADPRHVQAQVGREWEFTLAFFRRPGLPHPRPGDCVFPLVSCQLELTPSGHLILLLSDLLEDRNWAGRVAEASSGWLTKPDGPLHVTLLQVGSRRAFDWLERRLTEPVAGGGTIWLGDGQLVFYKDRALSTLIHCETLTGSRSTAKAV